MMTAESHNEYQRRYFERSDDGNVRLQPRETPYVLRHFERTAALAQLAPGQRVLEVGAGLGRFTSLLVGRGLDVVASDLSPHLLASLAQRHAGLETLACDVADVAERAGEARFDRIVGFFMLHHLADFDRVFAGLARVLRPGGRMAFCEPNAWCPLYYVQIALSRQMTWQGDGGVRHMRPSVILPSMERAGLVDLRAERYGFLPPFAYNRAAGRRLDAGLERVAPLDPVRAFQLFAAARPAR